MDCAFWRSVAALQRAGQKSKKEAAYSWMVIRPRTVSASAELSSPSEMLAS
jgi:hypothetical protein